VAPTAKNLKKPSDKILLCEAKAGASSKSFLQYYFSEYSNRNKRFLVGVTSILILTGLAQGWVIRKGYDQISVRTGFSPIEEVRFGNAIINKLDGSVRHIDTVDYESEDQGKIEVIFTPVQTVESNKLVLWLPMFDRRDWEIDTKNKEIFDEIIFSVKNYFGPCSKSISARLIGMADSRVYDIGRGGNVSLANNRMDKVASLLVASGIEVPEGNKKYWCKEGCSNNQNALIAEQQKIQDMYRGNIIDHLASINRRVMIVFKSDQACSA